MVNFYVCFIPHCLNILWHLHNLLWDVNIHLASIGLDSASQDSIQWHQMQTRGAYLAHLLNIWHPHQPINRCLQHSHWGNLVSTNKKGMASHSIVFSLIFACRGKIQHLPWGTLHLVWSHPALLTLPWRMFHILANHKPLTSAMTATEEFLYPQVVHNLGHLSIHHRHLTC